MTLFHRRPASALLAGLLGVLVPALAAAAPPRELTTAIEVRSLSRAEAESHLPAHLRGVIVFVENASAIFLQDETSTTFFRLRRPPAFRVGDEVEVRAATRMGLYLPGLDYAEVKVVGHRPLPEGIPVTYDDLVFGRYHYQRVSVEGIVRSLRQLDDHRSVLQLAMGSRVIDVHVEALPANRPLVDHKVRVTGLAAGVINAPRRQLVQPYVRVIGWSDIESLAAPAPVSAAPLISAAELLAFDVRGLGERRVRVRGTVSATFADDQAFLQQGDMAFAVRFSQPTPLAAGDRLEVIGFPSMERFSASVVDAELVSQAAGPAPAPLPVGSLEELFGRPGDPLPGKYDGHLVQVAVTIRDAFKGEAGLTLIGQGGARTVQVRMPESEPPPSGALVRLTGVCQVESSAYGAGFQGRPGSITLRVPNATDLVILRRPSWWTPRRLGAGLALLAGLTLLAGLWIAALRRQVARQTAALRARIQSEAALAERQRIAREFHDTLEQELAGVSLRLDALATRPLDDKGRGLIGGARNLVSRIQAETRDLISDLRDATELSGDLPAALAAVATRQATDSGVDVQFESSAGIPTLPAATVHDLRMIARESVTNALKHGRAARIRIDLARVGEALELRITDDGCGFDPATALETKRGHFGCAGIRERSRKLGAEVAWRSEPGRGTTVEVLLPLATVNGFSPQPPSPAAAPATPPETTVPRHS